jgi:hypothetical protein
MPSDDHRVAYFDTDVAEELLDLVDDRPGEADEDLLDRAAQAIQQANGGLPAEAQQAVARGDAIALGLQDDEIEAVTTLIEQDEESDQRTLRSLGRTLKSKLRTAAKKAGRR